MNAIEQLATEGLINFADLKILPIDNVKQQSLDKYPGHAFQSACAATSVCMALSFLSSKKLNLVQFFTQGVNQGAINNKLDRAYIESYEVLAKIAGLTKEFQTLNLSGNEVRATELIKAGNPLIIFIGAPNNLHHVELAIGYINCADESLLYLNDPGYQNDTHLELKSHRLFHFSGDKRSYSKTDGGLARSCYKFGWFA